MPMHSPHPTFVFKPPLLYMEADDGAAPKKRVSSAACDYCRRLHEKCDGMTPCGRCARRGKVCAYTSERPKKRKSSRPIAPFGSASQAVSPAALGPQIPDESSSTLLKETALYRSRAMRLVQTTIMSTIVDGPRLAKYQCTLVILGPPSPCSPVWPPRGISSRFLRE